MKTKLIETVYSPGAKIDKEAGIVRDVKILGRESKNGRKYSDKAMADAVHHYEGVEVNIDHDRKEPNRERGLMEGFGVIRGAKQKDDGVYGDLHYLKSHPATPVFVERAERFPENVGLSHNADGDTRRDKSGVVVESISRVNSVDVVRNPATNKGLWESASQTVKQFLESLTDQAEAVKASGLLEMDYAAMEMTGGGDENEQMLLALEAMVAAAMRNTQLDLPARIKQAVKMLNAFGSLAGGESGDHEDNPAAKPDGSETESDEEGPPPFKKEKKPMAESTATVKPEELTKLNERLTLLESENTKLKKQEKARALVAEADLTADDVLIESLVTASDEAAQKRIIEREKSMASHRPAPKHKPLIESAASREQPLNYPKDSKEFAAALR